MIEVALALLDYFVKLAEQKEGNIEKYFDLYIAPAYEVAQKVYSDYLELFHALRQKIEERATIGDMVRFIEDGRRKYLPLRRQLYAEVKNRWREDEDFGRLPKFEKGLLGLLMG